MQAWIALYIFVDMYKLQERFNLNVIARIELLC